MYWLDSEDAKVSLNREVEPTCAAAGLGEGEVLLDSYWIHLSPALWASCKCYFAPAMDSRKASISTHPRQPDTTMVVIDAARYELIRWQTTMKGLVTGGGSNIP